MTFPARPDDQLALPVLVAVDDPSQVGDARRAAVALAAAMGLDETARGEAGIIATEAAGNLAKFARGGVLVLQPLDAGGVRGIELLAVDRGPGMADPERCLADGYSTAGTPGTGLGAIRRLASEFVLDSRPGQGTVLLATVTAQHAVPATGRAGAVAIPAPGERVCGDGWAVVRDAAREVELLLCVDGLGHGPQAAQAAGAAVRRFREVARGLPPAAIMDQLHGALRATRGAAAAVAEVDGRRGEVRFAGVGNIGATVVAADGSRSMVSHNGIVGHQVSRIQEFTYPAPAGALVVLASDGVRPAWRLDAYPGLLLRHPTVVAATIWRDHTRTRDDATVLVHRVVAGSGAP